MVESLKSLLQPTSQDILLYGVIIILISYKLLSRNAPSRIAKIPVGFFLIFLFSATLLNHVAESEFPTLRQSIAVVCVIGLWFGIIRLFAFVVVDYVIGAKAIRIPSITRDMILVILYVIAVMVILRQKLNIDVASLIATSAILTAIIGLALQETLGNLFSGLALNFEKPYNIGDWVAFDKYKGRVRGISWRSTTVVTPENELIVIPNNLISRSHIVNYSHPSSYIVSGFTIGLDYGVAPNRAREVIEQALKANNEVLSGLETEVRLSGFGDHTINYEVRYWIDIKDDYERGDKVRAEVMTSLWYRLRRANIRIPYPTRVQYQAKEPGKEEHLVAIETALKGVDLFSPLKDEERRILAAAIDAQDFAMGEQIVMEGDAGDCMFIVANGNCEVQVRSPIGQLVPVAIISRGDFFGEMSLMTGEPRSATVAATSDVTLYRIEKDDMMRLLEINPEISTRLSEILAKRLEEKAAALAKAAITEKPARPPTAGQILQRIRSFFHLA